MRFLEPTSGFWQRLASIIRSKGDSRKGHLWAASPWPRRAIVRPSGHRGCHHVFKGSHGEKTLVSSGAGARTTTSRRGANRWPFPEDAPGFLQVNIACSSNISRLSELETFFVLLDFRGCILHCYVVKTVLLYNYNQ